MRVGLHNGFDLSTKAGFTKACHLLRERRPRYLHVSPSCDAWSIINNANQRNPQQVQRLEERRNHGRKILKHCAKLMEIQIQELRVTAGVNIHCVLNLGVNPHGTKP